MKPSRTIVLLLLFISAIVKADNHTVTFDSANAAYAKGKYEQAIRLYYSILESGQESSDLYFNLGNAYFKSNETGKAILNYERAKKLNPDDEDLATNLKMANQHIEDRIEAAPQLFLSEWKDGLSDIMSEKAWSIFVIMLICIGLALIAVYIVSRNRILRQVGFYLGSVLIILSVFSYFFARNKYNSTINNPSAIILSPSVTVNGSPSEKGTKLFILHEGVKVDITGEESGWTEIRIANGNVGWVKSGSLEQI